MYLFRHFLFVLAVLKWHWSFSTAASNENCHKAVYGKGCNSYIHMDDYYSYGVQGGSTTLEACAAAVKDLNGRHGCIGSHFFFEYAGYCNCPKDHCTLTAENMNAGGSGQLYSVEGDCEQFVTGSIEYQYNDASCGTSWTANNGVTFQLAVPRAATCGSCGDEVSNFEECVVAASAGEEVLSIGPLSDERSGWGGGGIGCHIQDGENFQFTDTFPHPEYFNKHTLVCKVTDSGGVYYRYDVGADSGLVDRLRIAIGVTIGLIVILGICLFFTASKLRKGSDMATPDQEGFFWSGRWKTLRSFTMLQCPFEIIMIFLGFVTTGPLMFGGTLPLLSLIGLSIVVCKCCCTENGGRCMAITYIVLNSIALVGSVAYFAVMTHIIYWCVHEEAEVNEYASNIGAPSSYCDYTLPGLSFGIFCFVFRIVGIVLASRVSCCRPKEWNNPSQQIIAGIPTANLVSEPVIENQP